MTAVPADPTPQNLEFAHDPADLARVRHLEETMRRAGLTPHSVFTEPEKTPESAPPAPKEQK